MAADRDKTTSLLTRRATRRGVVGASLAAASVAAAYVAVGDKLDLFGSAPDAASIVHDTDAIKKESVRISHLLRRAGFGVTGEEHDRYQSMGLKAVIDELVNYSAVPDDAALGSAAQIPIDQAGNRGNLAVSWLVRMANTKRPLQEKMTLFWHGLLTSQLSVVRDTDAMLAQNEFFRANAMGNFAEILRGVSMDRAMMVYLDTSGSQRRAPNENYARELMELFSLGVGNYSEEDIREAARAFTGWVVPRRQVAANAVTLDEPVFRPERFDDGIKAFMGKSGNFRPDDIVNIIVDQPAHARFIVGRLFSFFVYPDADDKTVAPFVDVYWKSNRSIGAVVEALLRSEAMYSAKAYRAIVRSPVEYTVAAIKALGLAPNAAQVAARGVLMTAMGQTLFEPPNVAGWPGGAAWLNSSTMFARLNFVNAITSAPQGRGGARPQPGPAQVADLGTAAQALARFLPMVLDDNVADEARQVLFDFGGGPDTPLTPEQLRGLVYLVLASPQFHLS